MKLADLKPAPYNPREIADDALAGLAQSVESFGDLSGIAWNKRSGFLVCGHQRIEALRQRGAEFKRDAFILNDRRFPVRVVDWDEQTERAANTTANNPHISGDWTEGLSAVLEGLKDDLPNFEGLNLDKLLADAPQESPEIIEDEAPEPPSDPITKPGDLWVLGRHRLLCGNCTKEIGAAKVTDAAPVNICATDPPYGIGFQYDTHDDKDEKAYWDLMRQWFAIARGVSGLVVCTVGNKHNNQWFREFGPDCFCVWFDPMKQSGHKAAHLCKSELLLIFGKVPEKWAWDTWKINSVRGDGLGDLHPCPKPVALFAEILKPATYKTVYDPFLGSGTTLIAAEQLGRRCFGIEISPKYCDVVVERWQNLTGEKAKREPV